MRNLAIALVLGFAIVQCAHQEASKDDPDALFKEAEEAFKDERYLIAIERYRDIKNRFPYSARATDAELRIADAYFEQESYPESGSAYEIFRELHPTHAKSDYVQYRIGLSFYHEIPSNSARDLSAAHKAIEAFQTLTDRYPSSGYLEKAKEFQKEARKRLAEHENYVADFYFRRKHFLSASYRYSALLQDFPGLGYDEEALLRLGQSYFEVKMFGNSKDALRRLVTQYPNSNLRGEAESLMEELNKKN